ncbi:MAG: uroporphyrinogen decarboxylase [Chloroflexi bacterium]|nr:uroporphyrinogen decarboxylase [Chloroflexota bacterium]
MSDDYRFLKAARRESVDATPIWLMRQAGRYMAEYRALREKHSMLEVINTPELATEVTLQPINAFDLDAAIIFADILPILIGMGLDLEFVPGKGPQLNNPIRSAEDVTALATPSAQDNVPGTLAAISMVREELNGRVPLIGFSGAPFTLASYAIEGGGSKNYVDVKSFMWSEPRAWQLLMEKLTHVVTDYLIRQIEAGAQAVQIFDSWAGILSPGDYQRNVLHFNVRVAKAVARMGVPVIYFGTNMNGMLDLVSTIPVDVYGVDSGVPIDVAWNQLGGPDKVAVQGNIDPIVLHAPWNVVQQHVDDVLRRVGGRPGHIFNLGHGIHKETPVDNVKRLCEYVHEQTEVEPA